MTCNCCGGTGTVNDIVGNSRPCSRCSLPTVFEDWYQKKLNENKRERETDNQPKRKRKHKPYIWSDESL